MDVIWENQFFILLGFMAIGFAVVAWRLGRIRKNVLRLYGGRVTGEGATENILRRILCAEEKVGSLEPRIDVLEDIAGVSVQKVGFLRFNPFQDTGGDNSFALALLDARNNGVLLSSFYAREGVRVYAKNIVGGKTRYPLSEEEKKVLEETVKK